MIPAGLVPSMATLEAIAPATTIDRARAVVGGGADGIDLSITSGGSWAVAGLPPWLNADTTGGIGDGTVRLEASANPGHRRRVAHVQIGGQPFEFVQRGRGAPVLNLSTRAYVGTGEEVLC